MFDFLFKKQNNNMDKVLNNIKYEMEKSNWFKNNVNKWLKESKYRDRFLLNDIKDLKSSGEYNRLYLNFLEIKLKELGYNIIENEYMGAYIYSINNKDYIHSNTHHALEIAYYELNKKENKNDRI